jgi:ubiquinone/menaquinone biosynthesis C-methylase UbiE
MSLRAKLFAVTYDRLMASTERGGLAAIRRDLLSHAAGDTLEVGAGTGTNLAFYGPTTVQLSLTEPDPSMLRRLEPRAAASGLPTKVLRAPAEDLPFDDDTFDTAVATLVLCGVDDQPRAVREIQRVLKPGGRLLFIEHVRADACSTARLQDRCNWLNRLVAGCDCNRPTLRTLERNGFEMNDLTHGELPSSPAFARPLVTGIATCPTPSTAITPPHNHLPIGDHR